MSITSIKTSGSTLADVPGVTGAIERLQELANLMENDAVGFSTKDINHVDGIIDALTALREECVKLHEKYETETIKASQLRYILRTMPEKIKLEITAAVHAARQSDANEQSNLETKLAGIYEDIARQHQRQQELEEYRKKLYPQRDQVLRDQEEIVAQLNYRLAEKAAKQIVLNETKEQVRDTRHKIEDIADDIQQLKEDLIQERAEARVEKKKLKKAVYDTSIKAQEQKEVNAKKEKEMNELHEKLLISDEQAAEMRRMLRKLDKETTLMKEEGEELKNKIINEEQEIIALDEQNIKLLRKKSKIKKTFDTIKADLQTKITKLEGTLTHATAQNKIVKQHQVSAEEALAVKMAALQESEDKLKIQSDTLRNTKQKIANDAQKIGYYEKDVVELEAALQELHENHEDTVKAMKRRIQERREQIDTGKKERNRLQKRRDSGRKDIEMRKTNCQKDIQSMNMQVAQGKRMHDELTKQGIELQKILLEKTESIATLEKSVQNAVAEYHAVKKEKEQQLKELQDDVASLKEDTEKQELELTEKKEPFEKLEESHKEIEGKYEEKKRLVVSLKNEKLALLDTKEQTVKTIEHFDEPTLKLQEQLKCERASLIDLMKEHAQEVRCIEESIYVESYKLKQVLAQNIKFNRAISGLQEGISHIEVQKTKASETAAKLQEQFAHLHDHLQEGWKKDVAMEKAYAAAHEVIVEQLGVLMENTKKRENVISDVARRLSGKLQTLDDFLNNVAKRRPKDSAHKSNTSATKRRAASPFNLNERF